LRENQARRKRKALLFGMITDVLPKINARRPRELAGAKCSMSELAGFFQKIPSPTRQTVCHAQLHHEFQRFASFHSPLFQKVDNIAFEKIGAAVPAPANRHIAATGKLRKKPVTKERVLR
jgi:hypothetical protein